MDGHYHSVLVLSRWPKMTFPGIIHRLTNLRLLDYTITVNIDPIPVRQEISKEEKAHERIFGDYTSEKKRSLLTVMQKKERKIAVHIRTYVALASRPISKHPICVQNQDNKHPLAEVFGFPAADMSAAAERHRTKRLCPFNNKVPNCTKDKAQDPLGVCSVFHNGETTITCPIRFRQNWIIADDAADFFFDAETKWTALTEIRLKDGEGQSAGNIDVVLCAYDDKGRVTDFGALEVQAVYISGNVRNPFERYMVNPSENHQMDWTTEANYPRPDYLSSSRKRLAPQLLFKGGILNTWGKKSAVALNKAFFATLTSLPEVPKEEADIAWLIYDLKPPTTTSTQFELVRDRVVYTKRLGGDVEFAQTQPESFASVVQFLELKIEKLAV